MYSLNLPYQLKSQDVKAGKWAYNFRHLVLLVYLLGEILLK
jgi:hypothetical protein